MSKRANPTLVGLFVIGAIALVVAGLVIFGTGAFYKERLNYVMYFKGSVIGLDVGAPVTFRGVKVGAVSSISLQVDQKSKKIVIPVGVKLESDRVEGQFTQGIEDPHEGVKALVKRGMRAQLGLESILTGLLYIELEVFPDAEPATIKEDGEYPEIPTVRSDLDRFVSTLKQLPIEKFAEKTLSALEGIERILNAPEILETVRSIDDTVKQFSPVAAKLNTTIDEIEKLVRNIDGRVQPLATDYRDVASEARKTINDFHTHIVPLLATLKETSAAANQTLDETSKAIANSGRLLDNNSRLIFETQRTLKELTAAARSVRNLSDYLERHPDALLRGKGTPKGIR